jgi:Zn-finger nucleic acid-binding protein
MTFQFLCPQGHLLQGDEAHMGMQCQCPQCGTAFIIPTVEQPGRSEIDDLIAPVRTSSDPEPFDPPDATEEPITEGLSMPDGASAAADAEAFAVSELGSAAAAEAMLHIPCPNGHELETPLDMIGERVMCPHCRAEFRLRRENSIEFLRQQEIIDRRRAKFWFQLSVVVASFVVVVLIAMFALIVLS